MFKIEIISFAKPYNQYICTFLVHFTAGLKIWKSVEEAWVLTSAHFCREEKMPPLIPFSAQDTWRHVSELHAQTWSLLFDQTSRKRGPFHNLNKHSEWLIKDSFTPEYQIQSICRNIYHLPQSLCPKLIIPIFHGSINNIITHPVEAEIPFFAVTPYLTLPEIQSASKLCFSQAYFYSFKV